MSAISDLRGARVRSSRTARARLALVGDMASDPRDGGDFGKLVESHRDRLHRRALRLSGNSDTAHDLVQQTLLRALERRAQFQSGSHLETWLVTILGNLFLDQLRHRKVERRAEPALSVSEAVEDDLSLATVSDDELYAAIDSLAPELSEVVELCYLRELRYREAAAILKVPSGTVATRLMRARGRLRELLTTSRNAVKP